MEIENRKTSMALSEREILNMKLICDVARENGSSISLKDLISFSSVDCSEEQLADLWEDFSLLSSRYRVASGLVLEKVSDVELDREIEKTKKETSARFDRANSNIASALEFGDLIRRANLPFKVLSISGSTSYLSVSETDDLDFFCIAKSGAMWFSFARALLLARAFQLSRKFSSSLCLSYVSDEDFVRQEISNNKNGLFARDAISTRVILGEDYFVDLLRSNSWMSSFFPKLYNLRVGENLNVNQNSQEETRANSPFQTILNLFLYYTAGTYIKVKSSLLNRKFARDKKLSSRFQLRIGKDHCIYESAEYVRLRKMYSALAD